MQYVASVTALPAALMLLMVTMIQVFIFVSLLPWRDILISLFLWEPFMSCRSDFLSWLVHTANQNYSKSPMLMNRHPKKDSPRNLLKPPFRLNLLSPDLQPVEA